MLGWRAWMYDGTVYPGTTLSEWQQVPKMGVVGVVVYLDPPYRRIIDGYDWIWLEDGEFKTIPTHDEWGKWNDPPTKKCDPCLKRGAGVEDEAWAEMQREMIEAKEAP
jgi:hypothetical protein